MAVSSQKGSLMILGVISPTPSSNSRTFCRSDQLSSVAGIYGSGAGYPARRFPPGRYHLVPRAPKPAHNPGNGDRPPPAGERLPNDWSVPSPVRGFPKYHPGRAAALAVAKVPLKGANLFLEKYPKKLLIHIGGQHTDRFICNNCLQI